MKITKLNGLLRAEKENYLKARGKQGGKAPEFISLVDAKYPSFETYVREALGAAAREIWEEQEPSGGNGADPVMFSDFELPRYLTRRSLGTVLDYEKVHIDAATLRDFDSDTNVKARKSIESSAKLARQMKALDEAIRRAGGDMNTLLRDVGDAA